MVYSQDDKQLRAYFSDADLKKLNKAEEYRSEADQLTTEVNQLYLDIVNIQTDTDLSEKAIASKVRNLEERSLQKQISASGFYEKSNEIKYAVYKKYIDEFWVKNADRKDELIDSKLLEEEAGDNYFQAISYRIDAKKLDGLAKIEKLNTAYSLEIQALEKQITTLQTFFGVTAITDTASARLEENQTGQEFALESEFPDARKEDIVINREMIDSYNRYISSGQLSDTTLSTGKISGVSHFDSDRLLALWYEYMYGIRDTSKTSLSEPENADMVPSVLVPADSSSRSGNESLIIKDENDLELIGNRENVVFRVQIAANRTELSQRALSRIYYGTKNVEVINEDGWYKYSVGDFASYEEASDFRKNSGLSSAFVIAYRKGEESQGKSVTVDEPVSAELVISTENRMARGLLFRVQIAASHAPIPANQLGSIYRGNYPVEVIYEDGWYKYQFLGVRLYSDARRIVNNTGIKGYIVAYENGIKVALSQAIAGNRDLEAIVARSGRKGNLLDTEFHIQLAASKSPIPSDELRVLYNGPEPVFLIIEDGWYKYHLKSGSSYADAQKLKQICAVKDAFIVAYVRGIKTNTYQAVQETLK